MPGNYQGPTTEWTPNGGWQTAPVMSQGYTPQSNPWQITNPNTSPGQPTTINDPTATATPQVSSWTGSNGLQTTGVMNPFGQTQNNPAFGFNLQNLPNPFLPANNPISPSISTTSGQVPNSSGNFPFNASGEIQTPPTNAITRQPTYNTNPSNNPPVTNTGFGGQPAYVQPDPNNPLINPSITRPGDTSNFLNFRTAQGGNPRVMRPGNPVGSPVTNNTLNPPTDYNPINYNQTPTNNFVNVPNGMSVMPNGTFVPTPSNTTPTTGGLDPLSGRPTGNINTAFTPNYLQGVTSGSLDQNGNQQYSPTNPMQFADPATAQWVAQTLGNGATAQGTNISGPGMGFSQPMQMINGNINAGLAANELSKYGSQPGSYGRYLLARDQSGTGNFPSYDAWASTQPNYNPGTRNVQAPDTAQNNASYLQNPQQFAQNNPGSGLQNLQNNQAGDAGLNGTYTGVASPNIYNNIYSQLAPILSLLQLLGLGGNNNFGSILPQQNTYQPPPALNLNSLFGFPYFSQFA